MEFQPEGTTCKGIKEEEHIVYVEGREENVSKLVLLRGEMGAGVGDEARGEQALD